MSSPETTLHDLMLVNNSHGDAGLAAIEPDYALVGVVGRGRSARVSEAELDRYLIPKSGTPMTEEQLPGTLPGTSSQDQSGP